MILFELYNIIKKAKKGILLEFFSMFFVKSHKSIFALLFLLTISLRFNASAQEFEQKEKIIFPFKIAWTYFSELLKNQIASDNTSDLYVSYSKEKISSLNLLTGEKRWDADLGGEIISKPLVGDDQDSNIFIVTKILPQNLISEASGTKILSLSRKTGITNWQSSLGSMNAAYLYLFDDRIIVVGDKGDLFCVNSESGMIIWQSGLGAGLTALPFASSGNLFIGTTENKIIEVAMKSGHIVGEIKTSLPVTSITSVPKKNKENVFWGNMKGEIVGWDTEKNKEIWKIRTGGAVTYLTNTSEGLVASSFDNFIYFLSPNHGNILWKKRLADRAAIEPFVLTDKIIASSENNSSALILDLKSGRVINKINLDERNYFLNSPLFSNNLLIFPTAKGIIAFDGSGLVQNNK